jgi:hypothetical protein
MNRSWHAGADSGFFAGRGPTLGADPDIWLGVVGQCADRRLAPMLGSSPEHF